MNHRSASGLFLLATLSGLSLCFNSTAFAQRGLIEPQDRPPERVPRQVSTSARALASAIERAGAGRRELGTLEEIADLMQRQDGQPGEGEVVPAISLPVDHLQLAVRHDPGVDLMARATSVGVPSVEVRSSPLDDWSFLTLSAPLPDATRPERVRALAALDGVAFVAPVLRNEDGWAVPTADILMQLEPGYGGSIGPVLSGLSDLAIVEEEFGGMQRAYRLRSSSTDGADVLAQAKLLAQDPRVTWAEPDFLISARRAYIPNDPGFGNLWGFLNTGQGGGTPGIDMDVDLAWDVTRGASSVRVLVLDDGSDLNHPDLNEFAANNLTTSNRGPCDRHGVPVAGCVSARIDNSLGTVGVAPYCPTLAARVFVASSNCSGSGAIQSSWIVNGLAWGETLGALVSNTSLQIGSSSSAIKNKYSSTRNNGMVHFGAAGNNNQSGAVYPASLSTVQEISAIEARGKKASFSNYSSNVIAAPGKGIYTTDLLGSAGFAPGNYAFLDGTSFASPYVAGIAALMRTVNPNLGPAETVSILQTTTIDLGANGRDPIFGWGLANANNAVLEAKKRYNPCPTGSFCHPNAGYGGPGVASLAVCAQQPLSCASPVTIKLVGAPANQPAWLLLSTHLNPTNIPILGTGLVLSPTPNQIVSLVTNANGEICIPNLPNCGTSPLFLQVLYAQPAQQTLGFSNVVRMDFGPLSQYEVGQGKIFARIQDAINAATSSGVGIPLVMVYDGTYQENLVMTSPMAIREAQGATAVLKAGSSTSSLLDVRDWTVLGVASFEGIDILADSVFHAPVLSFQANAGGHVFMVMKDLSITDATGVIMNGHPFVRVTDNGSARVALTMQDIQVQATNHAYVSFFQVRGDSTVTTGGFKSALNSPPAIYTTLNTSAVHLFDVSSTANPGAFLLDTQVRETNPTGEMFKLDGGIAWALRSPIDTASNSVGVATIEGSGGSLNITQSRIDARSGTQQAVFRMPAGEPAGIALQDSAVLFDATKTGLHAVIDASQGGHVHIHFSTIHSTTSHQESCAVYGPRTAASPSAPTDDLEGTIDRNIFVLPGSDAGAVSGVFGRIALDSNAQNVRYAPGGFPSSTDKLPGQTYAVNPLLAADGYHLTASSAVLRRTQSDYASIDIDGEARFFPVTASTSFGCDHIVGGTQTGLQVGPGQQYATIQAAIDAASPGATIVVHGGTYNEELLWNKPVDIVEAYGAQAVLNATVSGGRQYVIHQTGWPNGESRTWDGIDVITAATGNNDVIRIEGSNGVGTCIVKFENCSFTDGVAAYTGWSYFSVVSSGTFLWLDNTFYDPKNHHYAEVFAVHTSAYISVNNSYLGTSATTVCHATNGGQIDLNQCLVEDRGSEIMHVSGNGSLCTLNRSRVNTETGRLTTAVGMLGSGNCRIGINRSLIDATNGTFFTPIWFTKLNSGSVLLHNSAIVFHSGRTDARGAIDARLGGDVKMTYSTIRNVDTFGPSQQVSNGIYGPAQASATLTGSFMDNIFDIPGSDQGAIRNHQNQSIGTVNVTTTQNLVHIGTGNGLFDRLPGPKLNQDPNIDADGFHLTGLSKTLPRPGVAFNNEDVDGDSRPTFNRNYGCDEILP